MRFGVGLLVMAMALVGCGRGALLITKDGGGDPDPIDDGGPWDDATGGGDLDAGAFDADVWDGDALDASTDATSMDAELLDATMPDATPSDAAAPDATVPDSSAPDAAAPDANVPDSSTPDATMPDANTPDADRPDGSVGCTMEVCGDNIDNDCDGLADCDDVDCGTDALCNAPICEAREIGVAACTDGVDGDCDGQIDCADPDCSPLGPNRECCNGIDDTGDGRVDLFSCRCFDNRDCRGVGSLEQVCWTELFSVCAPRCDFLGGDRFCERVAPNLRCVRGGPRQGQCVPR